MLALRLSLALLVTAALALAGPILSAYYANWQADLLPPEKIPFDLLTHLDYFVAVPSSDGTLKDYDAALASKVIAAAKPLGVSVSLTVGGWTGSQPFSTLVATAQSRTSFATSLIAAAKQQGFDGLEIDWEYPGQAGQTCNVVDAVNDGPNLVLFLQELRKQGPSLRIGAAVNVMGIIGLTSYAELGPILDTLTIMAYDISSPTFSQTIGPNAPLKSCNFPASGESGINHYVGKGFPASKILLGVPAYGFGWGGLVSPVTALGGPFSGTPAGGETAPPAGPDECGSPQLAGAQVLFNELTTSGKLEATGVVGAGGFQRIWDECSSTPFLTSSNTLYTYDDPQSIGAKAKLAKDSGIGGLAFSSTTGDTANWLLINAAQDGLGLSGTAADNKITASTVASTRPTDSGLPSTSGAVAPDASASSFGQRCVSVAVPPLALLVLHLLSTALL